MLVTGLSKCSLWTGDLHRSDLILSWQSLKVQLWVYFIILTMGTYFVFTECLLKRNILGRVIIHCKYDIATECLISWSSWSFSLPPRTLNYFSRLFMQLLSVNMWIYFCVPSLLSSCCLLHCNVRSQMLKSLGGTISVFKQDSGLSVLKGFVGAAWAEIIMKCAVFVVICLAWDIKKGEI